MMPASEPLADVVRSALLSHCVSASTVTSLQSLLRSNETTQSKSVTATRAPKPTTTGSHTIKHTREPTKITKKRADVKVYEDDAHGPPPKTKQALATELFNISMRILSDASAESRHPVATDRTANKSRQSKDMSNRALQLRSGNENPAPPALAERKAPSQRRSQSPASSNTGGTCNIALVAECARLSIAYLRSISASNPGKKVRYQLQLEQGMMTLTGHFVNLRLYSLAAKELHAVKERLESLMPHPTTCADCEGGLSATEKCSLSGLLRLDLDWNTCPDVWPLVSTYYVNVIHVIAALRQRAAIEEALDYLQCERQWSPASLILRQAERTCDWPKAIKLLQNLSRAILQLCPSISSSADGEEHDSDWHLTPLHAFKLQMLSLSVRQQAWKLAKTTLDFGKEAAELFSKCLSTLLRRLPPNEQNAKVFSMCIKAYGDFMGPVDNYQKCNTGANVTSLRLLSTLAEKANMYEDAYSLAEQSLRCCKDFDDTHSQVLAVKARKISALLCTSSTQRQSRDLVLHMQDLRCSLRKKLSGTSSDYRILLGEISNLYGIGDAILQDDLIEQEMRTFSGAAAEFATLYAKSFPGYDTELVHEIIHSALKHCGSDTDLLQWVSLDTARLFIQAGALAYIVDKSSRMPLNQAWTSHDHGIALGRVLKILLLRAISSIPMQRKYLLLDDEIVDSDHQGTLAEWQFHCALEIAHKPRYESAMQELLPEMLKRLSERYTETDYPLRRKRVGIRAYRSREEFPKLVPYHALEPFYCISKMNENNLGNDQDLALFATDIEASFVTSQVFYKGSPTRAVLWPHLQTWSALFEGLHDARAFERRLDSPSMLSAQLVSIEQYFTALGDDASRLFVAKLLTRISSVYGTVFSCCRSTLATTRAYLSMGYVEKASEVLQSFDMASRQSLDHIDMLDLHLCRAETFLVFDNLTECRSELETALNLRQQLEPKNVRSSHKTRYQLLHGLGWLIQSEFSMANASPREALRSAKRATRIMNSIWSSIGKSTQPSDKLEDKFGEEDPSPLQAPANKVSKLNLSASNSSPTKLDQTMLKGAAYWPLVRLLCRSLMHLASVYLHHGTFIEANQAYEQAIKAAESVGSARLSSIVRSHHCQALVAANRIEQAELCLTRIDIEASESASLIRIAQLQAEAATRRSEPLVALERLQTAAEIAVILQSDAHIAKLEHLSQCPIREACRAEPHVKTKITMQKTTTVTKPAKTGSRIGTKQKAPPRINAKATTVHSRSPASCHVLQKLEANILIEMVLISAKTHVADVTALERLNTMSGLVAEHLDLRVVEHKSIMRKVARELETDFTFNALQESTLAFPALGSSPHGYSGSDQPPSILCPSKVKTARGSVRSVKPSKNTRSSEESLERLLMRARDNLGWNDGYAGTLNTVQAHKQWSLTFSVAMIMAATTACRALSPAREALAIDAARISAAQAQHIITSVDRDIHELSGSLAWPDLPAPPESLHLTDRAFQESYIDILPLRWTAVSLCLNEAADELYVARYQQGKLPFVMRLPFSRQRSEDANEEVFDFHMGKSELEEIVSLSNYSCHNSKDYTTKGAKTNWWAEREALDRRLQELLINIENIWFGGFKGIFSQRQRNPDQAQVFREAFDCILDRHLPSRRTNKRACEKPILNEQVLELFTALDLESDNDLEELLADLLYFVVDILQFSGERNAYDEIDFDSMMVDIQDALQAYHETEATVVSEAAHTVLILDKRLQSLPWESLPCLEGLSVSRVDSMLTLRNCITSMRLQTAGAGQDGHILPRSSGTYILNPSADLPNTEAMLAPELTKLSDASGWHSIVRTQPSEDELKTALASSSILLYFGHGAGSQFIRPKAVRRLDRCSAVVWLMGCSSGAITEYGDLEPFAVPFAYLGAGLERPSETNEQQNPDSRCFAVVATLWDVTDKDIDRFSLAVGGEWGLWKDLEALTKPPLKTPRKRENIGAPSTPDLPIKPPKTPQVRKTPARALTPTRNHHKSRHRFRESKSLADAVAKSRDACYLRYLNGAAPVVYGVPVCLGD